AGSYCCFIHRAPPSLYTLSLHDALPILKLVDLTGVARAVAVWPGAYGFRGARRANFVEMNGDRVPVAPDGHVTIDLPAWGAAALDRKSTRLNSSHRTISHAVFCLKKKTY